jgi:hypothetical protein
MQEQLENKNNLQSLKRRQKEVKRHDDALPTEKGKHGITTLHRKLKICFAKIDPGIKLYPERQPLVVKEKSAKMKDKKRTSCTCNGRDCRITLRGTTRLCETRKRGHRIHDTTLLNYSKVKTYLC